MKRFFTIVLPSIALIIGAVMLFVPQSNQTSTAVAKLVCREMERRNGTDSGLDTACVSDIGAPAYVVCKYFNGKSVGCTKQPLHNTYRLILSKTIENGQPVLYGPVSSGSSSGGKFLSSKDWIGPKSPLSPQEVATRAQILALYNPPPSRDWKWLGLALIFLGAPWLAHGLSRTRQARPAHQRHLKAAS